MTDRPGWDDERPERHDEHFDETYDEAEDPGVTLVPQTPGQWAIALAVLALLVGGLGGVYWNSVSRQAAADEAISAAMARLAAASQSDNTPQSLGAALRDETPMSGRYPIGPDGKLLKPIGTPVATPPDKPENMKLDSKEGMEAFTQYIVDSIEYMWATNDTSTFEALSDSNCEWCRGVMKLTTDFAANGGWALDAKLTIVESSVPFQPSNIPDAWRISVKLELSDRISYNGMSVEEKPGQFMSFGLIGQHKDGKWTLLGGRHE